MADTKITALTALTGADPANDVIPIVDVSDTTMAASGTTKKISVNNILGASGTATLASATITGDLTVATSLLKTDSANTRVGFGTNAPSYTTHIRTLSPVLAIQDNTSAAAGVGGIINFLGYTSGTSGSNVFGQVKGVKTSASVGGELQFFTSDSAGSSVQRYLIDSTGVSTWSISGSTAMTLNANGLGVGVVPSAGKGALQLSSGINFPATQVASSDANTLDDYEEGTFTPTIVGSTTAGTATYSIQTGRYTKIGRLVYFQTRITWTGHTGTGDMSIGNLPFSSSNVANSFGSVSIGFFSNVSLTASNVATAFVEVNSTSVALYQYPVGGGATTPIPVDAAADIMVSGSYTV